MKHIVPSYGCHNIISTALSQPSMAASASTRRNSSKAAAASRGNGSKRGPTQIDTGEQSPLRRSKRLKSSDDLGSPALCQSAVEPEIEKNTSPIVDSEEKKIAVISSGQEVKEEEEEKEEVSAIIASPNRKGRVAKQEPVEEITKVESKTSKNQRTKKESKEVVIMPLAARTQGLRMFVGAHVSAAKGVFNAVNNSVHIGGNAFALFLKSQRKWDNPPLQDDHRDQFRQLCREQAYDASKYILPHGSYLVNLAQGDKAKAKQAYDSFLDDLRRCEELGISLYNFHPGSANQSSLSEALERLAKALTNALSATSTVVPVLETMCGHGTTIGGSLTDFQQLLPLIPQKYHSRIGICIDTCHSFAAGYDLASPTGFKQFMSEFEDIVGIQYLRALHLNDSRAPRGSKRDLHANIGTGFLGLRAFHNVMNEPRFEGLPMILETPIDRPVEEIKKDTAVAHGEDASDEDGDSCCESDSQKKKQKKTKQKSKKATPSVLPDLGVWAREIKLLESLIGMDPEGAEFKALEAQLAEEGREMRQKYQEQYERKLEAEEKQKNKLKNKKNAAAAKDQETLVDMMKGSSSQKRKTSRKRQDEQVTAEGEN